MKLAIGLDILGQNIFFSINADEDERADGSVDLTSAYATLAPDEDDEIEIGFRGRAG